MVSFDLTESRSPRATPRSAPNDVDEYAALVSELLDDPVRRKQMGEVGRERVAGALSWTQSQAALLARTPRSTRPPGAAPPPCAPRRRRSPSGDRSGTAPHPDRSAPGARRRAGLGDPGRHRRGPAAARAVPGRARRCRAPRRHDLRRGRGAAAPAADGRQHRPGARAGARRARRRRAPARRQGPLGAAQGRDHRRGPRPGRADRAAHPRRRVRRLVRRAARPLRPVVAWLLRADRVVVLAPGARGDLHDAAGPARGPRRRPQQPRRVARDRAGARPAHRDRRRGVPRPAHRPQGRLRPRHGRWPACTGPTAPGCT